MKIQEFIDIYCPEIRERAQELAKTCDLEEFPNDGVDVDESGEKIPYVLCNGDKIPIADIIANTEEDFARLYPDMECRELYKQYVDALIIMDGEDALNHIRNAMVKEQARVKAFSEDNSLAEQLW